ncbi:hypothetical protein ELI13_28915 (plasmid) [Rhizobium ruizarguesonis]|uniref:Uncharacterized protein n=1 Tax=Rhizobium ruizarguesonis TaxID=2081791 RepID=A0AAE8Q5S4_9HYPH|nr:hypothetical protein [Rhizobium leguminosarum bv. viciae]TAT72781.1 hypothetical protein ELI52_32405 [Rhizobium ruizarguesonis]TAU15441.1 hypothetical protein ELI48_33470 [Rhizobium ruizarguesonis]TAU23710.1 hypothetical protein ELI47_25925 [Rhizobium ruizarguesonis]TAU58766.1 hypothetical protein ELI45_34685 [Rhizobium ruizarguesonis]
MAELLADIFDTDHGLRGSLEKEILARLCHAGKPGDSPVSHPLDQEYDAERRERFSNDIMPTFFNLQQDWLISRLTPTETCANERSSAAILQTIRAG